MQPAQGRYPFCRPLFRPSSLFPEEIAGKIGGGQSLGREMEPNLDSLMTIAEVGIGFVAFSTIVAVLQQSFGRALSAFQVLLVHFYIEVGLLNVGLALLPLALFDIFSDPAVVWKIEIYAIIFISGTYLPSYVVRRRKIDAPTPLASFLVMVGYAIISVLLVLSVVGDLWQPSKGIVTMYLLWAFSSSAIIFVYFLGSFLKAQEPESTDEMAAKERLVRRGDDA